MKIKGEITRLFFVVWGMDESDELKCLQWFETFGTEKMGASAAVNGLDSLELGMDARKTLTYLAKEKYFANGFALNEKGTQRLRFLKKKLSIIQETKKGNRNPVRIAKIAISSFAFFGIALFIWLGRSKITWEFISNNAVISGIISMIAASIIIGLVKWLR